MERTAAHKLLERLRDLIPGGASDDPVDLRSPDYHLALFSFREAHLLSSAARRIKGGTDRGEAPDAVFSEVQDHVIAVGRAHLERLVLEAFAERVAETSPGPAREALESLYALHALSMIEADRAWFMEHGRLSSQRAKAITAEVNALCRAVRPLAQDLVDAFGVPSELLRAPDLR